MHTGSRLRPRAFTLVELLFTMAIIFLIMALLLGGIRHVMKFVKGTGDAAMLNAIKQGATQFGSTFGFAPPLVKDGVGVPFATTGPLVGPVGSQRPDIFVAGNASDLNFLRFGNTTGSPATSPAPGTVDPRFSLYSLSYYVLGALDIDGVPGAGARGVKRDGSFEKSGRTFSPFFDPKGNSQAVVETMPGFGHIELRDAHGVAIRYYRWKQGRPYVTGGVTNFEVRTKADMNIPWILGDPDAKPELKDADYAIVSAGPNGLFGDEFLIFTSAPSHPQAMSQNNFEIKLGVKSGMSAADLSAAAMADNLVVVGVEPHR